MSKTLAENLHSQFDDELGWVNIPNKKIPNMYGAGASLTIDSAGFRTAIHSWESPPANLRHLICLGDSFTFGYGVDDNDTWCHQLETLTPNLETINLGLGGYGFDQAYQRYKREYRKISHELVLFAFISDDFKRMQFPQFSGSPKPVLKVENGRLRIVNYPLAPPSMLTRFVGRHQLEFYESRTIDVLHFRRYGSEYNSIFFPAKLNDNDVSPTVEAIVKDTKELAQERGAKVIFVYLPTEGDYIGSDWKKWNDLLLHATKASGAEYVNLIEDLWAVPPQSVKALFIQPGEVPFYFADGHYNSRGNRFVSEALSKKLEVLTSL